MNSGTFEIGALLVQLLYIGFIGFIIYCLVLFVKLARRGIKALDIYINEKNS